LTNVNQHGNRTVFPFRVFALVLLGFLAACAGQRPVAETGEAAKIRERPTTEQHVEVGVFYGSTVD
jgi:hypothetical protein